MTSDAVTPAMLGTAGRENAVKTLQVRGLVIDPAARSVQRDGKEINLTAKEFNLLWTMANHIGRVFSREDLHDALWKNERGEENGYDLRTVDVHIRRLREKLERDSAHPEYILTKWGVGYYFAGR